MGRIRTIKPDFFTSEDIVGLSPLARLLYIATWCEADKEGRLAWRPGTMKLRYLPADDYPIEDLCAELIDAGLVVVYGDLGQYAFIPTFAAHQHLNPRESASSLPEPDASLRVGTRQPRVPHASPRVDHASPRVNDASARVPHAQGGREGKGREDASRRVASAKPPPCPDDVPDAVWNDWLALRRSKKAPVTATVLDGARTEAGKAGMTLDAFLREWCTRGSQGLKAEWLPNGGNGAASPAKPGETPELDENGKPWPKWRIPGLPVI